MSCFERPQLAICGQSDRPYFGLETLPQHKFDVFHGPLISLVSFDIITDRGQFAWQLERPMPQLLT